MDFELSIITQESYVSVTVDNPMKTYPYDVAGMQTATSLQQTRGTSGNYIKNKPENTITAIVWKCGMSIP